MALVPSCPECGKRRWEALREETLVSLANLGPKTGRFGPETSIDGDLISLTFRCRDCETEADEDVADVLNGLYYRDVVG